MPSDEAYDAVLRELSKIVDQVRSQREDLTEVLRQHRDVVFRAINLLNHEVIGFTDRMNKDDVARSDRQKQLDIRLDSIDQGQQKIQRWQWIRVAVEIMAIVALLAFVVGSR